MQVNTQTFIDLSLHGHMVWVGPIKIILAIVILYNYMGPAGLAGFAALICLIPLNSISTTKYNKAETDKLKEKDKRIKIINEVLNGIKVIKYYGWEISFDKLINNIRNTELKLLKKCFSYYSMLNFTFGFTAYVVRQN